MALPSDIALKRFGEAMEIAGKLAEEAGTQAGLSDHSTQAVVSSNLAVAVSVQALALAVMATGDNATNQICANLKIIASELPHGG